MSAGAGARQPEKRPLLMQFSGPGGQVAKERLLASSPILWEKTTAGALIIGLRFDETFVRFPILSSPAIHWRTSL
jgi:hypothetical protein